MSKNCINRVGMYSGTVKFAANGKRAFMLRRILEELSGWVKGRVQAACRTLRKREATGSMSLV